MPRTRWWGPSMQEQATALPGPIDLISGVQAMEDHLREQNATNPDVIIFGDAEQTAGLRQSHRPSPARGPHEDTGNGEGPGASAG